MSTDVKKLLEQSKRIVEQLQRQPDDTGFIGEIISTLNSLSVVALVSSIAEEDKREADLLVRTLQSEHRDLLAYLVRGYSVKEITALLKCTPNALSMRKRRLFDLLGVDTDMEAALIAFRAGLVT